MALYDAQAVPDNLSRRTQARFERRESHEPGFCDRSSDLLRAQQKIPGQLPIHLSAPSGAV